MRALSNDFIKKFHQRCSFVLCFFGLSLYVISARSADAPPERCSINPQKSVIVFASDAPLETFEGKTKEIAGWMIFDPARPSQSRASVRMSAASLVTGNRMRDKDMREKFLETNTYPEITFELTHVVAHDKEFSATGNFSLHGVTKMLKVPVALHRGDSASWIVRTSFPLLLSDYNIERPQFLWMKLADTVQISVDLNCSVPPPQSSP